MTENNTIKSSVELSKKNVVISVVTLVVLTCLAVGIFFYSRWHEEKVVLVLERWGNFGDFFGGILNPIIGLGGVILLAYTLIQNQKALAETAQIMKSQADLAQHDHRRQSIISILTSSTNVALSPTVNTFEYEGNTYNQAHIVDISGIYVGYILDNDVKGCDEFDIFLGKTQEMTLITALFAVKKLVDEESEITRRNLLLMVVISFIPVQVLLALYTRIRAGMIKGGQNVMKIESLTVELLLECIEVMDWKVLIENFEEEAERLAKKK